MIGLLTAFHVLVGVVLILGVLLQSARGTDLAGAFGGMGSQTAFGPRGTATFLSKATVVLAVIFMVTSVSLAILSNRLRGTGGSSVLSGEQAAPTQPATPPGQPAAPGPGGIPVRGPRGARVVAEPVPVPAPPPANAPAPTPGNPPVQVPVSPPAQPPAP